MKINAYIEKPESLLPVAANNLLIRPRITHLLEARKKLLLDHIENFKAEQTVGKIRDLIYNRVKDEGLREKLNSELDEFEKRCEELKNQREDLKNQLHENQSKMWRLILIRDAMVTVIFGVIGLIIVSAFVVGMFSERQIPDVFSDFLLTTLGYLGASLSMKGSRDMTQQNYLGNNFQVPPSSGAG